MFGVKGEIVDECLNRDFLDDLHNFWNFRGFSIKDMGDEFVVASQ